MSADESKATPRCRDCGAENDAGASECWLCHCRDRQVSSRLPTLPKSAPSWIINDLFPRITAVALGIVVIGCLAIAPGLVFVVLLGVVPPWGAALIARHRRTRGLPTSIMRRAAWTVALGILVLILLSVALFIAFWLICVVSGPARLQ